MHELLFSCTNVHIRDSHWKIFFNFTANPRYLECLSRLRRICDQKWKLLLWLHCVHLQSPLSETRALDLPHKWREAKHAPWALPNLKALFVMFNSSLKGEGNLLLIFSAGYLSQTCTWIQVSVAQTAGDDTRSLQPALFLITPRRNHSPAPGERKGRPISLSSGWHIWALLISQDASPLHSPLKESISVLISIHNWHLPYAT